MGSEKQKSERLTFLVKYALVHPEYRKRELLAMFAMATWGVERRIAIGYAEVALARIQLKGDLYGISPEVSNEVKEPKEKTPVRVFGAMMEDPASLKPLSAEEEKLIMDTPLEQLLTMIPRPKPPATNFRIIEEK